MNQMREPYDHEWAKIADLYAKFFYQARHMANTQENVSELGKRIQHEFYEAGFIVNVDMTGAAIVNPATNKPFKGQEPTIELIGYVNDQYDEAEVDHDRLRFEISDARDFGEKYRGQKRKVNQRHGK